MRRVLVVDDDKENLDLLSELLTQNGHSVQTAGDGEQGLHRIRAWKPHLILLDINLPGISGLDLIPKIREASGDDYIPVVLVSANVSDSDVKNGLDAGADDYLTKPFRVQELTSRVRAMGHLKEVQDQLRRALHRAEELSSHDELTGALNFKMALRKGEEELLRARRMKKPLSMVLINIDGFAKINHDNGFPFGNALLQQLHQTLKKNLRSGDYLARVAADEFLAILVETDLSGAEMIAHRMRDAVEKTQYKDDHATVQVKISMGIVGSRPDQAEVAMNELLQNANEALRSAQASGQGQIEIYSFT